LGRIHYPQEIAAQDLYVCPDLSSRRYQCLGYLRQRSSNPRVRPACWRRRSRNPGQHDRHPQASRHTRYVPQPFANRRVGHFPWACSASPPALRTLLRQASSSPAFRSRLRTLPPVAEAAVYAERNSSLRKLCRRRSEYPALGANAESCHSEHVTRVVLKLPVRRSVKRSTDHDYVEFVIKSLSTRAR